MEKTIQFNVSILKYEFTIYDKQFIKQKLDLLKKYYYNKLQKNNVVDF